MKYLKKFNENKEELQEFCDNYLAYLFDDKKFIYEITSPAPIFEISYEITIKRIDDEKFEWDDIKDYLIPFVTITNEKFNLDEILFQKEYYKDKNNYHSTKNSNLIKINDLITDNLTENEKNNITEITLTLNESLYK